MVVGNILTVVEKVLTIVKNISTIVKNILLVVETILTTVKNISTIAKNILLIVENISTINKRILTVVETISTTVKNILTVMENSLSGREPPLKSLRKKVGTSFAMLTFVGKTNKKIIVKQQTIIQNKNTPMIVKPYISFLNYDSDSQLIADITAIIVGMTGNPNYPIPSPTTLTAVSGNTNFPTPSPTLVSVGVALNEFSIALSNAADGGATLTAIKNAKRAALVSLVRALALYVQSACNGDLAVLKSSGFPTQKPQPQPVGDLPVPASLTVKLGISSGKLDVKVAPVPGAFTYTWRLTAAGTPTVVVQLAQSTATNYTFAGLLPGVVYNVEANAVGAAGPSGWTVPVPQMVV